jgi:hypothetical protein
MENLQFDIADFETAYNAFLGRPTLTKFTAIPHYAYLILNMPGPHGVISIRVTSSVSMTTARRDARRLKDPRRPRNSRNLSGPWPSPPPPPSRTRSCLRPRPPKRPYNWRTPSTKWPRYLGMSLPRLLTWEITWTPDRNSC